MTQRLRVRGWSKFQHYKKRRPPWIKLHRTLLEDYRFARLQLASKALAPALWLLASESEDGSVAYDVGEIAFRTHIDESDVNTGILELLETGFLEDASTALADASTALATAARHAPESLSETETKEEGDAETHAETKALSSVRALSASDLESRYFAEYGSIAHVGPLVGPLSPFSPAECDAAYRETKRRAAKPGWKYFLTIVQGNRERASPANPSVGYHGGSDWDAAPEGSRYAE